MQIHVVGPGQSLYGIAQAYNTTVDEIIRANELTNPNRLVIGQALVIPIQGQFYWVQPGDSLWSIARRFGLTYQELAAINGISVNTPLLVGMRMYIPPRPKSSAEFNAYVEPLGGRVTQALENSTRAAAPFLTYLSPFSFQVKRDGTLQEPPLNQFPAIAQGNQNVLVMVVTNLEEGAFSDELGRIILNDPNVQENLLNNIIATAQKYGMRDIHFDFEFLRPEDRQAYNQFLRRAKERFSELGWFLSTALAPKVRADQPGRWYEAHDYRAHGEIVDFVVIMTYEWGYSGGPAMPVSPLNSVREVLQYAITEIPPEKIMMGQNLYGYDWTLPFSPGTTARAISPQEAIELAARYHVPIQYDYVAQAPFFFYTDEEGRRHEVWFEDARSIQAKFNLVKELNLRGVSYWKLGLSFPQNWLLIDENFSVVKK